ncbi:MAG: D-sedoheptulose-7-phosphate isomerase [Planctomycetota bacterium]|jgi:D-sedoheptulose 7-phosphate isomerase
MQLDRIRESIQESIATKEALLDACAEEIRALCLAAMRSLEAGGKLLFCGNGGSSCDAAHAAGELIGWFEKKDREGVPAIALGHEIPSLTAIANDAGFEQVFARQLKALGGSEDLLVGISTSGGSKNVVAAMEMAKTMGMSTAALVSTRGGPLAELAEVAVRVPSENTARIQECHLLIVHILCAAVEEQFCSPG